MPNQQRVRKQHFVPQCYLKHFMLDGNLYTLDIPKIRKGYRKQIRKVQPKQICYIEDYYTIDQSRTNRPFGIHKYDEMFIEREVFTSLENKYPGIVNDLIKRNFLDTTQAEALTDFILLMKLRNPYWKTTTIDNKSPEWMDAAMADISRRSKDDPRFSHIPDDVKEEILARERIKYANQKEFTKDLQYHTLIQRFYNQNPSNIEVRETILSRGWQLWKAPENGPFFITTDNPGIAFGKDGSFFNTRFMDGFFFFFPISPMYCIAITDEDKTMNIKGTKLVLLNPITSEIVIQINNGLIQKINNLLIASDDWYISQIADLNKPRQ